MAPLADTLDRVASVFEECIDAVASETARRAREEIDEWRNIEAPEIWETIRDVTRRSRRVQAERLRRDRALPTTCPESDAEAARYAARGGVSLTSALHSFRIGHAVAWDAWLEAVERVEIDERTRRDCLRVVSRFAISYDDRVIDLFTAEFTRARERELRDGRSQAPLILDLIDGTTDDAPELDYDLTLEHIGVVAWGPTAASSLHRLAAALDRRLLMAELSDDQLWGWLGGRSELDAEGRRRMAHFEPDEGSALAAGNPARGLKGFRRSHREAGEAYLVALRRANPVTLYSDVALEAFALRDEDIAREFVASELRHLNGNGRRSDDLRNTLRQYFASSQNAAAAAAALQVHEQTVARRIRAIEERIGCPLNQRRAELELALRLEQLLEHPPSSAAHGA